jgi:hypothetical protein
MTEEEVKSNIEFKNDSARLREEFDSLKVNNEHLHFILLDCGDFCQKNFKKNVVVTMIYRTDAEQDELYKNVAKYKEKKFKSPHQFFHAFDLRSSTFNSVEIDKLVNYLNTEYNSKNFYKFTAICHEVSANGLHLHIQFVKK